MGEAPFTGLKRPDGIDVAPPLVAELEASPQRAESGAEACAEL